MRRWWPKPRPRPYFVNCNCLNLFVCCFVFNCWRFSLILDDSIIFYIDCIADLSPLQTSCEPWKSLLVLASKKVWEVQCWSCWSLSRVPLFHGDPWSISHEVDGWIASDGHRRNLLGPFNVCGIGRRTSNLAAGTPSTSRCNANLSLVSAFVWSSNRLVGKWQLSALCRSGAVWQLFSASVRCCLYKLEHGQSLDPAPAEWLSGKYFAFLATLFSMFTLMYPVFRCIQSIQG